MHIHSVNVIHKDKVHSTNYNLKYLCTIYYNRIVTFTLRHFRHSLRAASYPVTGNVDKTLI
jgi:hypothetical protein